MSIPTDIKQSFFFLKTWKVITYVILCCSLIPLVLFSGTRVIDVAMVSIAIAFILFFIALTFYDLKFGFYGMIGFGFFLAFIDRMTQSSLPLYSLLFLFPFALFMVILVRPATNDQRFKLDWHPLLIVYFLPFAYIIMEIFNPQMNSFLGWLSYFRQTLSFLFILFICLYIFKDLRSVRFFFRFLLSAIFITGLYGCVQQWFGLAPWDRRWVYGNPDVLGLFSLYGLGIRKFSFLTDPANFGSFMAAGSLGTLVLMLESVGKKKKVVFGIFTVFILLGMSYSGTRTANIMVVSGLVLYLMITMYRKRTWLFALIAGLALLFILYAPIYGNVTLYRIRTAFRTPMDDASMQVRVMNRERIQPYVLAHPFGGGINTAAGGGLQYNPNHPLAGFPPDSSLFSITLEQGYIGLALHLGFLFLALFYAIHYFYRCRDKEIKTYYIAMAAMLFSLGLVGAYAQFTLTSVPQFFMFIPFIAIIIKLHTYDSQALTKTKS